MSATWVPGGGDGCADIWRWGQNSPSLPVRTGRTTGGAICGSESIQIREHRRVIGRSVTFLLLAVLAIDLHAAHPRDHGGRTQ